MNTGQIHTTNPLSELPGLTKQYSQADLQTISGSDKRKLEQLKATAKHFEGIFIHQILKQMQETIENASFDPEDNAGKQVHSMYSTFMADAISQQGGFGMWEQIYEQLVQTEGLDPETSSLKAQLDESA